MFALVVAGRLVQTDFQQVDAQKYLFQIYDATEVNHLVVFLTGTLPEGYGATVHFLWYFELLTKAFSKSFLDVFGCNYQREAFSNIQIGRKQSV
jgi:hypothetical protein